MTAIFKQKRKVPGILVLTLFVSGFFFTSCNKQEPVNAFSKPMPFSYSSTVLDKWMTLQMRLMRNATGIPNHALSRHYAYAGVAALESLQPGLHGIYKWQVKWNGLTGLPAADASKKYYFPANVNAALASINKAMFPNATVTDKAAIDSLETALTQEFAETETPEVLSRSADFGKAVAVAVYAWSETDGYKNANAPYTAPTGPGLWKPTPPAFAAPATPFWGNNRTIVYGSTSNTTVSGVPSYSAEPGSPFHNMVKEVFEASQSLSEDQKAMAIFWRDVPGATTPGHWLSIVKQVIKEKDATLDLAALAYALTGAAINDVLIRSFDIKYQYNVLRPVSYIREAMGHSTWSSYIGTPNHPEYISNHASLSLAGGLVLENLFGKNQSFTDHTYDYMGLAPRSYNSYSAIGIEAGISRLYAGIHYRKSIEDGYWIGKKVVANIFNSYLPPAQDKPDAPESFLP